MAAWTAAQLRNKVLEHLNIKTRADSAEAEDALIVDEIYDSEYGALHKLNLVQWSKGSIPNWAQRGLVLYLAGEAASSFNYSGQALLDKQNDGKRGLTKLQQQTAGDITGPPKIDFF
jgi:hypothetical protein